VKREMIEREGRSCPQFSRDSEYFVTSTGLWPNHKYENMANIARLSCHVEVLNVSDGSALGVGIRRVGDFGSSLVMVIKKERLPRRVGNSIEKSSFGAKGRYPYFGSASFGYAG